MQISIRFPFVMNVNLIEIEDRLPSIKIEVEVNDVISLIGFSVRTSCWIAQDVWNNFIDDVNFLSSSLFSDAAPSPRLSALDDRFIVEMKPNERVILLSVRFFYQRGRKIIECNISEEIDVDMLGHWRNQFEKHIISR